MTRRAYDETEFAGQQRRAVPTEGLFAPLPERPLWAQRWASLTEAERAAQIVRWKELLLPVVVGLARRSGPEGIIAGDVISEGITSGILWGEVTFLKAHPRVYSFVGGWLATLAALGTLRPLLVPLGNGKSLHATRKSERSLSHKNKGGIYLLGQAA